ncbi:hypothetical protein M3Y97_00617200 [Aphelenchoides bicaudatus]|nr:hypothetical protein M3Y97_00617200 [Aphelenchoides bicaudatus]
MIRQLILVLFVSQQIPPSNGFTFYEWMASFEKNSYICQDNNSFEPSFLSDEDAIQFNCESLCGNPLLTSQACSRSPSENNDQPACTTIPEFCLLNFIQEFNDEKNFHLLLNPVPMDKELFQTTKEFFIPDLIAPDSEDNQEISIQIITTEPTTTELTTTTTTTTQKPTTTERTTTTQKPTTTTTQRPTTERTTTTQRPTTHSTTTQRPTTTTHSTTTTQRPTTTTQPTTSKPTTKPIQTTQHLTTTTHRSTTQRVTKPRQTTGVPNKAKTLIGFRISLNAFNSALALQPKTTPKFAATTKKFFATTHIPPIAVPLPKLPKVFDNKIDLIEKPSPQDFFINEFNQADRTGTCIDEHYAEGRADCANK